MSVLQLGLLTVTFQLKLAGSATSERLKNGFAPHKTCPPPLLCLPGQEQEKNAIYGPFGVIFWDDFLLAGKVSTKDQATEPHPASVKR
jgi:hypothetical protein